LRWEVGRRKCHCLDLDLIPDTVVSNVVRCSVVLCCWAGCITDLVAGLGSKGGRSSFVLLSHDFPTVPGYLCTRVPLGVEGLERRLARQSWHPLNARCFPRSVVLVACRACLPVQHQQQQRLIGTNVTAADATQAAQAGPAVHRGEVRQEARNWSRKGKADAQKVEMKNLGKGKGTANDAGRRRNCSVYPIPTVEAEPEQQERKGKIWGKARSGNAHTTARIPQKRATENRQLQYSKQRETGIWRWWHDCFFSPVSLPLLS